jgi:transcriptional regulator with GAF, ATPase, and Fis domain
MEQYHAHYAPLFSHSPAMRDVREIIERVAETSATVLIRGESGVGKDLVARAIHLASPRRAHPLIKVNCAALPLDLLETELFGHEKGAFTGAYRRKLGKFEFAHRGTLFLDEIGELPLALQAKLLHVLQDHAFSRLGGRELVHVDVRVIAATNRNLEHALRHGHFREDLYYRLNVVEIHVPPLRERPEEIPLLAQVFLNTFTRQYQRPVTLPPETLALCCRYSWPGNIRELENLMRRLVILDDARLIHEELLARLRSASASSSAPEAQAASAPAALPLDLSIGLKAIASQAAREAERRAIRQVLDRVRWNRSEAARLLHVSYKTLLSKMVECGLTAKANRADDEGSP